MIDGVHVIPAEPGLTATIISAYIHSNLREPSVIVKRIVGWSVSDDDAKPILEGSGRLIVSYSRAVEVEIVLTKSIHESVYRDYCEDITYDTVSEAVAEVTRIRDFLEAKSKAAA